MEERIIEHVIQANCQGIGSKKYIINVKNHCPICGSGTTMGRYTDCVESFFSDIKSESDKEFYLTGIYRCQACERIFVVRHKMRNNDIILSNKNKILDTQIDVCKNTSEIFSNKEENILVRMKQAEIKNERQKIEQEYGKYNASEISQETFPLIAPIEKENHIINDISPKFYTIYNQSLTAKNIGLNEIYGMGLRKALEQLITDYLINYCKYDTEDVKYTKRKDGTKIFRSLNSKILDFIKDSEIQNLALAAKWLGNSEVHPGNQMSIEDSDECNRLINCTCYSIMRKIELDKALDKAIDINNSHKDKNK